MSGDFSEKFKRRPPGSPLRAEIKEHTRNYPANFPDFHLVHITSAGLAWEILKLDPPWLKATPCKVFDGRERLYFFVLRPLYRLPEGDVEQTLISHFPVAFIMDAKELGNPTHAAPFDTGAAARKRFDAEHSPGAFLDDYLLDPDIDAIKRFLAWGYGSADAYYEGRLKGSLHAETPNFYSICHSWLQIAKRAAPAGSVDLRGSAVELAYDRGIDLATHVKLCIFPDEFLQHSSTGTGNETILDLLHTKSIAFKTYEWKAHRRPNEHLSEINKIVREFYKDKGRLV